MATIFLDSHGITLIDYTEEKAATFGEKALSQWKNRITLRITSSSTLFSRLGSVRLFSLPQLKEFAWVETIFMEHRKLSLN